MDEHETMLEKAARGIKARHLLSFDSPRLLFLPADDSNVYLFRAAVGGLVLMCLSFALLFLNLNDLIKGRDSSN